MAMIRHRDISDCDLKSAIRAGVIAFGGNMSLRIYGQLGCKSGKRMKPENRLFFRSEQEAVAQGYRPCAHCMRKQYIQWKQSI
ncbi:Ada metal-binding domain-containing protein [Dyadobacter helix]|uniref:Ada metal-binding domain-containing protein n=1 Tax=Dyadobacter helix TaxID=2822344 RepID=UPI00286E8700|nr:Ada metal-binding domain-containing protein [Dyadobacter sp. CECT 9275]